MRAAGIARRAVCGIVMYAANKLQVHWFSPSTIEIGDVALFICTAAIANALSILLAATVLRGAVSYDMQRLAFCAVVVNLLSFIAFAAKNSPCVHFLNDTITVISYAQLARLLWPGYGNRYDGDRRYCVSRFVGLYLPRFYMEEKK